VQRAGKSALLYTGTVDVPPPQVVAFVASEALRGVPPGYGGNGRPAYRILDPACGAGVFLLAAFRALARECDRVPGSAGGADACLRQILRESVFGTDIDPESVSAARFVLLLAFLDARRKTGGIPPAPLEIHDVSSGLAATIRCGNSLIAPDYFSGKPVFPFNADERYRVNPFDWAGAFPAVIAAGGFDAVIGSPPPYRPFAVPSREVYFQTHYTAYAPSAGLYGYFAERGLSLLRPGGSLVLLVPAAFLRADHARPLRRLLLSRQIVSLVTTGRTRALPEGDVPVEVLAVCNKGPETPFLVFPAGIPLPAIAMPSPAGQTFPVDQRTLGDGGWRLEDTRAGEILDKIRARGTPLDRYVMGEIESGAGYGQDDPLVVDRAERAKLLKDAWRCRRFFVPLICPADIRRYVPERPAKFLVRVRRPENLRNCNALAAFLNGRVRDRAGAPDIAEPFAGRPKIVFAEYQVRPAFCIDPRGGYAIDSGLLVIPRCDPYLAAILNSALGRFVITHTCPFTDRGYHLGPAALGKFPVYVPDFDRLADKNRYDKMVSLVSHVLELNRYLPQAKTEQERRLVQQEIDTTDIRIDALVYDLYGLATEEIAVVEAASPP
jgi:hypothetical protein